MKGEAAGGEGGREVKASLGAICKVFYSPDLERGWGWGGEDFSGGVAVVGRMGPRVPVDNLGFLVMDGFLFHIIFPFFLSFFLLFLFFSGNVLLLYLHIEAQGRPTREREGLVGWLSLWGHCKEYSRWCE